MTRYTPDCPISGKTCKKDGCAWFCEEERRCAVALLPGTIDFLVRVAATQPYKTEEADI